MGSKVLRDIAKIRNAASASMPGRTAVGTGPLRDLTASEVRSLLSVSTTAEDAALYVSLLGSYTNPSWIVSIPNTKVTGLGTLSTQNGTLSDYLTSATAATTYASIAAGQPISGTVGQVLTKNSGTNYDSSWTSLVLGDRYLSTSTTSNAVSNGTKTFTIGTGLSYTPTQNITIAYDATHHMHGEVTTYNSGTGVLVVDINNHTGTGTYTSWVVNVGGVTPATSVAWGSITGTLGSQSDLSTALSAKLEITTAASTYVALAGSYTNPSWIVSIPNTKVTGLGTLATQNGTFSGTSSGTNTGDQDLSSYLTASTATSTYVPLTRTLNTLALSADQTFAVGTTGTDFAIVSAAGTHTFNIPDAGASARGLVTTGTQTIAGAKTLTGNTLLTQTVSASGSPTALTLTGAAHTTLTLSTEATDVNFNLARTVQFATGALTTQRAMRIQAPTYSFVGASTISLAATFAVDGPPVAGTNSTITTSYSIYSDSGWVGVKSSPNTGLGFHGGTGSPAASASLRNDSGALQFYSNSTPVLSFMGGLVLSNTSTIRWSDTTNVTAFGTFDIYMYRDAAGTLAQRNSTNAQTFRVYNTYTSSTSFENGQLQWTSNEFRIGTSVGSAGGTVRSTVIGSWNAAGTFTAALSVYAGSAYIAGTIMAPAGTRTWGWGYHSGGPSIYGGAYLSGNDAYIDLAGAGKKLYFRNASANICNWDMDTGSYSITNIAASSGSITEFTLTAAAHTGQTASTEATSVNFNLSATKQFATGAITTQRAMRIQAPTYRFVGASTITTASTLSISGPPVAGTNATITNAYALNVESGTTYLGGPLVIAGSGTSTLSVLSSVLGSSGSFAAATNISWGAGWGTLSGGSTGLVISQFGGGSGGIILNPGNTAVIQQRNATTAQEYQLYTTYTSATSYERINVRGKASASFEIGPENGSAGGTLRGLTLGGYSAGTTTISPWLTFTSSGNASFSQYATIQGGVLVEAGGSFTTNYAAPAQIRVRRAQGTQGSPTQATNGIQLGIIGAQGLNDAGAYAGYTSYISFNAGENITTTGCGGYFNFYTTPVGSTTEVMRTWIGAAGNFGIGVFAAEPSTLLTINGDMFRVMTAKTPATSGATGNAGEFCWDTSYLYCCTATNTWKRVAWSTF